jgi:hypothetical protein
MQKWDPLPTPCPPDADVVELPIFVSRDDLTSLEWVAADEGVPIARIIRRAIREYLQRIGPGREGNLGQ